jgi:glycerate kinase
VLVLAGQVALDEPQRRTAGITGAFSLSEYAGSVQRAMEDAAGQLQGLAARTAARLNVKEDGIAGVAGTVEENGCPLATPEANPRRSAEET